MLGNEAFIDKLVSKQAGVAKKVFKKITDLKNTLGKTDSTQTKVQIEQLKTAQKLYIKAAEKAGKIDLKNLWVSLTDDEKKEKATNTAAEKGKFSLKGKTAQGIEVYETPETIKNLSYNERKQIFINNMNNQYKGRTAKFVRNGHSYYATFEEADVRKNIYGDKKSDEKGWKAKINVGAQGNIFELVENSKYDGSSPETGKNIDAHIGIKQWDYFVKTVQIDNSVFDLVANVRKNADNAYVYSLQLNENKKIEAAPPLNGNKSAFNRAFTASIDNTISQKPPVVNSNFTQNSKKVAQNSRNISAEVEKNERSAENKKNNGAKWKLGEEFASQLDNIDKIPSNEALIVCRTPEVFLNIGLNDLPMTLDRTHARDAIRMNLAHKDRYIGKNMLKKLPEAMQSPIAVITSGTANDTSLVVIVELTGQNGRSVIAPVYLNGLSRNSSVLMDVNAISSVHERKNAVNKLLTDALKEEENGKIGVFYIDNKKAIQIARSEGLQLPDIVAKMNGSVHSITENGSPVKGNFKKISQTQTKQFKRWFGDSKVIDENGEPLVVYHGSDADFNIFDITKGRANMDIQGAFFSPYMEDAAGYGKNVRAFYLNIKNPANESTAYKALNRFKGQNGAGIKAREYLIQQGYDGVYNGYDEYIAFYPTQIKSATDNIGTFDGKNPDIRWKLPDTEQSKKISAGMSDSERAEILRNTSIKLAEYDGKSEDLNGKNVILLKSSYNSQAAKILKLLGEKFGAFKSYSNKNISLKFNYSRRSLNESVHKQGDITTDFYDFAKMLYVFDDIAANAVPIEVHTDKYKGTPRENEHLKFDYVLLSGLKDENYVIPIELHIKEFDNKNVFENNLYVSVTLGKIKIEDVIMELLSEHKNAQPDNSHTSSAITIPQLISKVNPEYGNFYKYFPSELLNAEQAQSKGVAVKDEEYRLKVMRGEDVSNMLAEKAKENGYSSNSDYQGTSAFNGAAPSSSGYYSTVEERIEAFENGEYEGEWSLGDELYRGIEMGDLEWRIGEREYSRADSMRKEAIKNIRKVKNIGSKEITMYRSVPLSVLEGNFRNGDWITPSRAYAEDNAKIHGWGNNYRIITQTVSVDDVWWDGNDIAEWGYDNGKSNEVYKNTENNVKVLEATYNDNSELIPLSKRFDETKNDMRWKLKDKPTSEKLAEAKEEGKKGRTRVLTEVEKEKEPLKIRRLRLWENWQIHLTNAQAGIEKAGKRLGVKDIEAQVNFARGAYNAAGTALDDIQVDINGKVVGEGLKKIIEPVRAKGKEYTEDFFTYLACLHHVDRKSIKISLIRLTNATYFDIIFL